MYNEKKEKYVPKNLEIIKALKEVNYSSDKICTVANYVTESLRETFQFIKDNPYMIGDRLANAYIVLSVSILTDQSSTNPEINYAILTVSGVVKKVCETYVELEYVNNANETIKSTVAYDDIVYLYHISIAENFEAYVNKINSLPPLCYCPENSEFDLLVKLAKTISKNEENPINIKFVLDGVLTREFESSNIAILRNLVVTEELFVNPITAISSFINIAKCN